VAGLVVLEWLKGVVFLESVFLNAWGLETVHETHLNTGFSVLS
jgi:hypothetical protein